MMIRDANEEEDDDDQSRGSLLNGRRRRRKVNVMLILKGMFIHPVGKKKDKRQRKKTKGN